MSFPSKIPTDKLYEHYYIENLTQEQIAKMYGLTRQTVQERMKRLGWTTISRVDRRDKGKPTGKAWQILLGTLIGDGYLFKLRVNARLELKHSVKQQEYLDWKIKNLLPWVDFTYRKEVVNKSGLNVIHVVSLCYPWLTDLHNSLYSSDGTRKISMDILEQIQEVGFGVWYLDDGTYHTARWNDYISIASMRYGKLGNELIAQWLEDRWGLKPYIYKYPNRPEQYSYCLQFSKRDSEKIRFIAKTITDEVPSMRYKVEKES